MNIGPKLAFAAAGAAAILAMAGAQGAGGGPDTIREQPKDPVIEAVRDAIAKPDWASARQLARAGVEKNPSNADYQNLYAYALRMGPNPPLDLVFRHYNEALRLDARHRGAHEYIGEAYLMTGNLAKAKEHLRILDDLCFLPCEEYSMLKKAVADYEAKAQAKPAAR